MDTSINVILVDDETLDLEMIKKTIPWEDLGFTIMVSAYSARDALEKAAKCPLRLDLMVSDVQMPIVNGLSLYERLRNQCPDLKALFISGHESFEFVKRALQLGAFAYVLKPIDNNELIRELSALRKKILSERGVLTEPVPAGVNETLANRIVEYIETHLEGTFDEALDIKKIAEHFQYSANYLSTVFKNQMGESLGSYVQSRRMQRAAFLLTKKTYSIKDIATKLNYATASHFIKSFRTHFQTTPGEYRRLARYSDLSRK